MSSKIIKMLVILFFAGVVAFSAMTFLATDLDAVIVYHKRYERKDRNGDVVGIECKGKGTDCRIEIIGKVPHLRP